MDWTDADADRPGREESAVSREDEQRALDHKLDRIAPSRRAVWPKDDRRSSERLPRPAGSPERRRDVLPPEEPPPV